MAFDKTFFGKYNNKSIPIEKTFWFLMEKELNHCKKNKGKIPITFYKYSKLT